MKKNQKKLTTANTKPNKWAKLQKGAEHLGTLEQKMLAARTAIKAGEKLVAKQGADLPWWEQGDAELHTHACWAARLELRKHALVHVELQKWWEMLLASYIPDAAKQIKKDPTISIGLNFGHYMDFRNVARTAKPIRARVAASAVRGFF